VPSPLIYARVSGLFVRFRVPNDLRARIGSQFIVRALGRVDSDTGRLLAALMASALSSAYTLLRREPAMAIDVKDLLGKAKAGELRDWTSSAVRLPNGAVLENVQVNTPQDAATFAATLEAIGRLTPSAAPVPAPVPAPPSAMLSATIETFLAQFKQRDLSDKVELDTAWTLRLFVEVLGDGPVRQIGTAEMDRFLAALAIWPSNATKRPGFRGLTVREVLAKAQKQPDLPRLAVRTKEKHLDRLRVFFRWCVDRKDIDEDPSARVHLTTKEQDNTPTRREFRPNELLRVFDPTAFQSFKKPFQYWAPLLALYSGMRVNEVAQLYVDDVECVNGIWGVHVAPRFPGQSVKNQSSWRFVPLHSKLLALGFVAYRDRVTALSHSHLFPGLTWGLNGPGDTVSDWFGRYLDRIGLSDRTLSFHSFRHTVSTQLDRSEVLENRIAELTGHNRGSSVLRRVYIKAATVPVRKADVERLKFPFIDQLSPCPPDRFEPYLRAVAAKAERVARKAANKKS
jgi:integrase